MHCIPRMVDVCLLHGFESAVCIIVGGVVKTMFKHLDKLILNSWILHNHFLGVHPVEAIKHVTCMISQGPSRSKF